jgi:hypothetical protein
MQTDQSKLNPELFNWLNARQSALTIAKTTTTPSGQTLDWIPIESQVSGLAKLASVPPTTLLPVRTEDAQRPTKLVGFELDDPKVERGPAGTVPILRPDISRLTKTVALKDLHLKQGGLVVNKNRPNKRPTDPNPAGYFHDTDSQSGTFYGWDGNVNVWAPIINNPAGPGDDHSILQVWLQNYDQPLLHSVESGWTIDQGLNGDANAHLFTYFTNNGYNSNGNNQGGYNTQVTGWVQYSPSYFPGILLTPVSSWGGGQFEISMKWQLYREPTTGVLNFWLAVNGNWIGYYPASLFSGGLENKIEWIGSGGEVYSSLANPEQTQDQMGSGWQAAAGWTKAAYLRNLRTQSDLNGTMVNNSGVATTDIATSSGSDPYTIQMDMNSGSSWSSYFYVGGPTPAAATFNQITFNIGTGGDDLRGDSSAKASVHIGGGSQTFTLKAQSDPGWGNNSDHIKTFTISGPAQPLSAFGNVTITLTSHNSFPETDDNWNIQNVTITLNGPAGSAIWLRRSGNPFARLTGSGPSVTF